MNKFFLLTCLLPFYLLAQPTITSTVHAPKIGQTYTLVSFSAPEDQFINVQPGEPGANRTWNFSNFKNGNPIQTTYINPNTLSLKDEIKALDVNIGGMVVDSEGVSVTLLKVTNQELISKGLTNDTFIIQSSPSPILMKFPFTFGNNYETKSGIRLGDSTEYISVKSNINVLADAYGSITTAEGMYNNVLRVKSTSIDSVILSFGEGFVFNMVDTNVTYQWFAQNNPSFVFILNGKFIDGELLFDTYSYLRSQTTSTNLIVNESLNVYPNPFHETITIDGVKDINQYRMEVFNSIGVKVVDQILDPNLSPNLNLSHLQSGNYFIRLSNSLNYVKTLKVTKI